MGVLGALMSAVLWIAVVAVVLLQVSSAQSETVVGERLTRRVEAALAEAIPAKRMENLAQLAKELRAPEIPRALAVADRLPELREQAVLREAALSRWAMLSPADAFRYISVLPESRGKLDAVRVAAVAFAKASPQRAAAAALAMFPGPARNDAIALTAEEWARVDLPSALRWAQSLPSGAAKAAALYNIRFIWVHADPVSASAHVESLHSDEIKNALIANVAGEWAAIDRAAAIRWADRLADGAEKDTAFANIAESWSDYEPQSAASFALGLPEQYRARAIMAVLARWAMQQPQHSLSWAIEHLSTPLQEHGFLEIFRVWTAVEPLPAARAVEALPFGVVREAAIVAYIEAVQESSPEAAARLALELSDPDVRLTHVEQCVRQWMQIDAMSAERWLRSAAVDEAVKDRWVAAGALP
jgi:hypothetical protein